jgi:hypothetical protein
MTFWQLPKVLVFNTNLHQCRSFWDYSHLLTLFHRFLSAKSLKCQEPTFNGHFGIRNPATSWIRHTPGNHFVQRRVSKEQVVFNVSSPSQARYKRYQAGSGSELWTFTFLTYDGFREESWVQKLAARGSRPKFKANMRSWEQHENLTTTTAFSEPRYFRHNGTIDIKARHTF